jgi:hypothetical protein
MVEPLPRFDFGRMQQFSAIQNYMFGMRITVWRNVKLHTSSFVRNSFSFSMMSYIQSVDVVTFASTLEKDWLLLMIGIFLALSVMLWIIDVGKNHFNFNVY